PFTSLFRSWTRDFRIMFPNREHLAFEALPGRSSMTNFSPKVLRTGAANALAITALLTGTTSLVSPAAAGDYDVGSIHISRPWSRATPKGARAGYMTLTNKGAAPDKVSCVSNDASAQCQIHSM